LQHAINIVFPYNEELCNAMIEEDFAGHTTVFSMMRDVCGSVISRKRARDNSDAWIPYQTRPSLAPLDNFGAIAWIRCQSEEVVGNTSNTLPRQICKSMAHALNPSSICHKST
jgi:coniferyl-aldehyde dehydrogenase